MDTLPPLTRSSEEQLRQLVAAAAGRTARLDRVARDAMPFDGGAIDVDVSVIDLDAVTALRYPGRLGLSIVYGIARDAGGTVTFQTSADRGTTFEVLLPLVTPTV